MEKFNISDLVEIKGLKKVAKVISLNPLKVECEGEERECVEAELVKLDEVSCVVCVAEEI